MQSQLLLAVVCLSLAVLIAGCGDDGDDSDYLRQQGALIGDAALDGGAETASDAGKSDSAADRWKNGGTMTIDGRTITIAPSSGRKGTSRRYPPGKGPKMEEPVGPDTVVCEGVSEDEIPKQADSPALSDQPGFAPRHAPDLEARRVVNLKEGRDPVATPSRAQVNAIKAELRPGSRAQEKSWKRGPRNNNGVRLALTALQQSPNATAARFGLSERNSILLQCEQSRLQFPGPL